MRDVLFTAKPTVNLSVNERVTLTTSLSRSLINLGSVSHARPAAFPLQQYFVSSSVLQEQLHLEEAVTPPTTVQGWEAAQQRAHRGEGAGTLGYRMRREASGDSVLHASNYRQWAGHFTLFLIYSIRQTIIAV